MQIPTRFRENLQKVKEIKYLEELILLFLLYFMFLVVFYINFNTFTYQHFTIQSESFIQGQLNLVRLDPTDPELDLVKVDSDTYYWALGIFPSILLMPFVYIFKLFGQTFPQGYLQFFITLGNFYLLFKLARFFKYKRVDALYLATAFVFGSVYVSIAFISFSWYFSQSITIFLTLLALHEFYHRKRYVIIGTLMALVLATRLTAVLPTIFFVLMLIYPLFESYKVNLKSVRTVFSKLIQLSSPIILTFLIMMFVNYLRFGSPFDSGYGSALIQPEYQILLRERYGLFDIRNIITNIYYYFVKFFDPITESDTYHLVFPFFKPNSIGLGFFFVSPIFIKLFLQKFETKEKLFLLISSLITLFVLLTYYASGYYQYGPRYILDLMPLWYILLLHAFKERQLNFKHYLIIIISSIVNLFMVIQLYAGSTKLS